MFTLIAAPAVTVAFLQFAPTARTTLKLFPYAKKFAAEKNDTAEFELGWQASHEDLKKIKHIQFADTSRDWEKSLITQLGVFYEPAGAALRATFIIDPDNVIQHVTVNNLNVGRSPEETLRVLDALQTGELCACNRTIGGETL